MLLVALAALAPPPLKGPAVVVLLKDGCPCARECRFALNALATACRGKVRFVGLLDGDAARARTLAKEAELAFPVLPDPKLALIRNLKGKAALDLRLLGKDNKLVGSWDALDRENVAALLARLQTVTGKAVDLDLAPFTVLPKVGCAFPP